MQHKEKSKIKTADYAFEVTKVWNLLSQSIHKYYECQSVYIPGLTSTNYGEDHERLERGHREPLILIPISEGIPQDVLESFEVQENHEDLQDLHLAPAWKQSIPLFSGEMREFFLAHLGDLDWSSRESGLSARLVQSLVSGFAIHLRICLSEVEGDAFLGALEVYRMEDCPVVKMEGDVEVVDAEFKCRD